LQCGVKTLVLCVDILTAYEQKIRSQIRFDGLKGSLPIQIRERRKYGEKKEGLRGCTEASGWVIGAE
jgi:hypothetical protein